jgi:acylglycerol lipase
MKIDTELHGLTATATEEAFRAADGTELAYIAYRRTAQAAKTAFVYLHGISSHAGWFDEPARMLTDRGFDVFCLDRRGSGINRENRGFLSGHLERYEMLLSDIRSLRGQLESWYENMFLIGLSWGGKLAVAYALTHPRDFRGLVLVTPGLRAKADMSLLAKARVVVSSLFSPKSSFDLPLRAEMFTTTARHMQYIRNDPLRTRRVTASFFMQSRKLDRFIDAHIEELSLPVLLFLAGNDRIIDNEGVVSLLDRRSRSGLKIVRYEDQVHSIQFDAPERMVEEIVKWQSPRLSYREGGG